MPWVPLEVYSFAVRRLATVCVDCIKVTCSEWGGFPQLLSTVPCEGFQCTREELEKILCGAGYRVLGWDSDKVATLW